MRRLLIATALCAPFAATMVHAGSVSAPAGSTSLHALPGLVTVGNHGGGKGNGNGNGNGPKRLLKEGGGPPDNPGRGIGNGKGPDKAKGNGPGNSAAAKQKGNPGRGNASTDQQREVSDTPRSRPDTLRDTAPEGRDLADLMRRGALVLAGPSILSEQTLSDDTALQYANCPPGLAKKDPPCVPPGLARQGVTAEEWLSRDADAYDTLYEERRVVWLDGRTLPDDPRPLYDDALDSDRIARLYGLDPAPEGQRYAVVDGMPVLLSDEDYRTLALITDIARVPSDDAVPRVASTAALSPEELRRLYRLPPAPEGQTYSVVNGQVIAVDDAAYEMLQLLRVARAVL